MVKIILRVIVVILTASFIEKIMESSAQDPPDPPPEKQAIRFLADLRNERYPEKFVLANAYLRDITYTETQEKEIYTGILNLYMYRWNGSTVPIDVSNEFRPQEKMVIWDTLALIERNTCVRFVSRRQTDVNYVSVVKISTLPIQSNLGMIEGEQHINLHSASPLNKYVILHLFMHTLGFPHQHIVSNRDDHITINWDNIAVRHRNEFIKLTRLPKAEIFERYDTNSIMHYDSFAGTKNGKPTVVRKDNSLISPSASLTEEDYKKVNDFYGCD